MAELCAQFRSVTGASESVANSLLEVNDRCDPASFLAQRKSTCSLLLAPCRCIIATIAPTNVNVGRWRLLIGECWLRVQASGYNMETAVQLFFEGGGVSEAAEDVSAAVEDVMAKGRKGKGKGKGKRKRTDQHSAAAASYDDGEEVSWLFLLGCSSSTHTAVRP